MLTRKLKPVLIHYATKFPVVAILGPRQSGKTTLSQDTFTSHQYVSLEDLDTRDFATKDPRGFLDTYKNNYGVILDEIQHVPGILSYIQTIVDRENKPGYFVLTGSQNFLISQTITQTLAGRIAILTLLPLSINEFEDNSIIPSTIETAIFMGAYPRIYAHNISPIEWYPQYTMTYLERDVRQIINVQDLTIFQSFVKLCAGRIGQLLNVASLSNDCGISVATARSWLSLLEASYIIFLLQPYHNNFSKRLIKSPKLYFFDTGLACSLLGIESEKQLATHYLRGGLVESLLISDFFKQTFNAGRRPHIYFWRDSHGHEVDCILEKGTQLIPIEIKAGKTISNNYFTELSYWNKLTESDPVHSFVIYGGNENQQRTNGKVLGWQSAGSLIIF